jgi:hypothetical protein
MKSRFSNKVFNGEMIVITSPIPLSFWYRQYQFGGHDTLEQLYRRISCYVTVTKELIMVYDKIDDRGRPEGVPYSFKNELVKKTKANTKKTDFGAAFEKICENAASDLLEEFSAKK